MTTSADLLATLHRLEAAGLEVGELRKQIYERERVRELSKPSSLDLVYPLQTPTSWVGHFLEGGQCPYLTNATIREGGQFRLSNAQKAVLRDLYGLTPTQTVTITNLVTWPPDPEGRVYIRAFTILSNIHVDWSRRKHVLNKVTIGGKTLSCGQFFSLGNRDVEIKTPKTPKTTTIKSTKTLEDLLNEYA